MLKIKEYVKVNSLEEAYELNQKKSSRRAWGNGLDEDDEPKRGNGH